MTYRTHDQLALKSPLFLFSGDSLHCISRGMAVAWIGGVGHCYVFLPLRAELYVINYKLRMKRAEGR